MEDEELNEEWRRIWPKTTCPDCGHESHEGYDLICTTLDCTRCVNGQCLRYTNKPVEGYDILDSYPGR